MFKNQKKISNESESNPKLKKNYIRFIIITLIEVENATEIYARFTKDI